MGRSRTGGGRGTNQFAVRGRAATPAPAPHAHALAMTRAAADGASDPFRPEPAAAVADLRAASRAAALPDGHPLADLADARWVFHADAGQTLYDALADPDVPAAAMGPFADAAPLVDRAHTDANAAYDTVWGDTYDAARAAGVAEEGACAAADDAMDSPTGHRAAGAAVADVLRRNGVDAGPPAPGADGRWHVPLGHGD